MILPAVRLTELGIRSVDKEVVEAAIAFGAKPRQMLREVQPCWPCPRSWPG